MRAFAHRKVGPLVGRLADVLVGPLIRAAGAAVHRAGAEGGAGWDARTAACAGERHFDALEQRALLAIDLQITAINFTGTQFRPGDTVLATAGYRNLGSSPSPAFNVRFVASVDEVYGNGDDVELLSALSDVGLGGGQSVTGDPASVTIPQLAPGTYRIIGRIDPLNFISESNESNNTFVRPGAITILSTQGAAADLQITAINFLGAQFRPGDSVTATATYRNAGNLAASAFTVRYVASVNAVYGDADDVELFATTTDFGLSSGQSVVADPDTVIIPNLAPGTYRILGKVDSSNLIPESNEANNIFTRPGTITILPPPAADFTITNLVLPATISEGSSPSVTVSIRNGGQLRYDGPLSVRFVASINTILGDDDDIELFSGSFSDQGSISANLGQTLTSNLNFSTAGLLLRTYAVLGRIDSENDATESNESNNIIIRAGAFTLIPPPAPDLQITTVTAPAASSPAGAVNVTATLRNAGNLAAGAFVTRFVLSRDSTLDLAGGDVVVGSTSVNALAGGASLVRIVGLQIPAQLPTGAYYLFAITDADAQVDERSESNNIFASATPVAVVNGGAGEPDVLVVSSTVAGAALPVDTSGELTLRVTATVRAAAGATGPVQVGVYLSRNRVLGDADDVFVGEYTVSLNAAVPASATDVRTLSFTIPAGLAPGSYSVLVRADDAFDLDERNEVNNTFAGPVVTAPTPADLSISFTPNAGSIPRGGFITGTLTLRNAGQTPAGPFAFRVGLTADATIDAGDATLLTGLQETGGDVQLTGLAGLQTVTLAGFRLPVPFGFTPGAYRVFAAVDEAGAVNESNENNNTFVSALASVTVSNVSPNGNPAQPDFALSASPLAGQYVPGQTIKGQFVLTNLGVNAGSPAVAAYLSLNNTFDASDILLTSSALTPGESAADSGSRLIAGRLVIPTFVGSGAYYLILVADQAGQVAELNETNNTAVSAAPSISVVRPTVSVTASDPLGAESSTAAGNPVVFTFTRTGPLTQGLDVAMQVTGSATEGVDYIFADQGPLDRVTFAPGQATVTRTVTIISDALGESAELIQVRIGRGEGYSLMTARLFASATINDDEPVVSIRAGAPVTEGLTAAGLFTLTRTGSTAQTLDVRIIFSGSADVDPADNPDVALTGLLSGPTLNVGGEWEAIVRFSAGQASRTVGYTAVNDTRAEGPESLVATVAFNAPANAYAPAPTDPPGGGAATITVNDNENFVSVTGGGPVAEGGVAQGRFTFTRTGALTGEQEVEFLIAGSASDQAAFVAADLSVQPSVLPDGRRVARVRFAPGQASKVVRFSAPTDNQALSGRTVRIEVDPQDNPQVGASGTPATATITDNGPVISLTGAGALVEGSAPFYTLTFTRTGPLTAARPFVFEVFGSADVGDDFTFPNNDVVLLEDGIYGAEFAPGQATRTVRVAIVTDDSADAGEFVSFRIAADQSVGGYAVASGRSVVSTTITDNKPVVTITATGASEATPNVSGRFIFSRAGGPLTQPLEVLFHLEDLDAALLTDFAFVASAALTQAPSAANGFAGRITIPANAASVELQYRAVDDTLAEGPELVEVEVDDAAGYSTPSGRDSAVAVIADNEVVTVVSVRALDATGAETVPGTLANTLSFTITRSRAGAPLQVSFVLEGDAAEQVDYLAVPHTVSFAAGELSKTVTITPVADALADPGETVVLRLVDGAGYVTNPQQLSATAAITDVATPLPILEPLTVTADPVYSLTSPFQSFLAETGLRNAGLAPTGPLSVQFILSRNNIIGDADDIFLGARTLSGLGSLQVDPFGSGIEFDLIEGLTPGAYWVGLKLLSRAVVLSTAITPNPAFQLTA